MRIMRHLITIVKQMDREEQGVIKGKDFKEEPDEEQNKGL
jgi:hypothetical protein